MFGCRRDDLYISFFNDHDIVMLNKGDKFVLSVVIEKKLVPVEDVMADIANHEPDIMVAGDPKPVTAPRESSRHASCSWSDVC